MIVDTVLEFDVTQDLIEAGERGDCESCPIALAVSGELDRRGIDCTFVEVGELDGSDYLVTICSNDEFYAAKLPVDAQNFMCTFDEDGPEYVSPIHVKLGFKRVGRAVAA